VLDGVVPPEDVLGVVDGVVVAGVLAFAAGFGAFGAGVVVLDAGGGVGVACGTVSGVGLVVAGGGVGVAWATVFVPGGFDCPTPRSRTLLAPPALSPYAAEAASSTAKAAREAVGSAPRRRLRSGGDAAWPHSTQTSWRSSSAAPQSSHVRAGGGGGGGISGSVTADQFRNTGRRRPLRRV
jgi:hypothetical protein